MDNTKIDKILQYALLVAGDEDDFRDRQLGPIHLIKYVYLADLAYAKTNQGETFTGVNWQFYKFGPWSQAVNQRIEPALLSIGAEKLTFPSDYDDKDDWVRWKPVGSEQQLSIERELPFVITSTLRQFVHKYGQSTPDLLSYVYSTEPMLLAAPNELLDFSFLAQQQQKHEKKCEAPKATLSKKKQKLLKNKIRDLRLKSKQKLNEKKKQSLVPPVISPRYDDVFFDGINWLDSLAGAPVEQGEKEAVFSKDIWKSPARSGENVPD
ncbi:MAG: hypothetical protein JRI80_04805 [Deltaproteobacteria bacterium]|nr:hypothetical protein [Deltaproteobacteria bacterium]